jgi:hypothetical protein
MSELLSNLKGDKRAVMESMLETTKTGRSFVQLSTSFFRSSSAKAVRAPPRAKRF